MTLGDVIFKEIETDHSVWEEVLLPYRKSTRDLVQVITALERMRWAPRERRVKLLAIQYREHFWNGEDIEEEIRCGFLIVDELKKFRYCQEYDRFDICRKNMKTTGLEEIDNFEVLRLAMYDHRAYPMFWTPGMSSLLLSAVVTEEHFEPIAKTFLRAYFRKSIQFRNSMLGITEEKEQPPHGRELTADEQAYLIKYVFLYNKISLYTAARDAYQKYLEQCEADVEGPVEIAQHALEDPEGRDLPLLMVDEDGSEDFLLQLWDCLKQDHAVIHMPDPQAFLDRIMEKPFFNEILLIGNLQEVEDMEKSFAFQRHLHRLLARGYRIVMTSTVPLEDLDIIDDRLKDLINQGLTLTIEEDM